MINQELMAFALAGKLQPEKKKEEKPITAEEYFARMSVKRKTMHRCSSSRRLLIDEETKGIWNPHHDILNYI